MVGMEGIARSGKHFGLARQVYSLPRLHSGLRSLLNRIRKTTGACFYAKGRLRESTPPRQRLFDAPYGPTSGPAVVRVDTGRCALISAPLIKDGCF